MYRSCILYATFLLAPIGDLIGQEADEGFVEYRLELDNSTCISEAQFILIEEETAANIFKLRRGDKPKRLRSNINLQLNWPLRQSEGFGYTGIYTVGAFVDQDRDVGVVQDYECGIRTYDNHGGTDISLWPFNWSGTANNQVEVVAAAPGIVVNANDQWPNNVCDTLNIFQNVVVILHDDDSRTWYGHLKKGSVDLQIGDVVEAGDFIGYIGSSGAPNGPHLHFHVFDPQGNRIDPFSGDCNAAISSSLWENQIPYWESTVNAVLTHSAAPVFPNCNYESVSLIESSVATCFPKGSDIYFASYYNSVESTKKFDNTIRRPDGTIFLQWDQTFQKDHVTIAFWRRVGIPANESSGIWEYEVKDEGQMIIHQFFVGDLLDVDHAGSLCGDNSSILLSSDHLEATNYAWNTGQIVDSIIVDRPGYFQLESFNNNACMVSSWNVEEFESPSVFIITSKDTFCSGDTVILKTNVGVEFSWSTGETSQEIQVSAGGTYSVNVSFGNSCQELVMIELTENEIPQNTEVEGPVEFIPMMTSDYMVNATEEGSTFEWFVEGGEKMAGGYLNEIQVFWDSVTMGKVCVVETNGAGCIGDTICLETEQRLTTSVIDLNFLTFLQIYPNPTSEVFGVDLRFSRLVDKVSLSIFNMLGQNLYHEKIDAVGLLDFRTEIDIQNLNSGVYFLKITVDSKELTKRIIVD